MTERHGGEEIIKGTNPLTQGQQGRAYGADRVCAVKGCTTTLSIYNAREACSIHDHSDPSVMRAPRRSRDRALLEGIVEIQMERAIPSYQEGGR